MDSNPVTSPMTPSDLLGDLAETMQSAFEQMDWAEDEIAQAQARHPASADRLFHAFSLLTPNHPRMAYERVYRAHCQEILERVVTGTDTRPGTAAEICCACAESSLVAPLSSPAAGLYGRMWASAFPHLPILSDRQEHHEALEASAIDALENESRRRLTDPGRTLHTINCLGQHHGKTVQCQYATASRRDTAA